MFKDSCDKEHATPYFRLSIHTLQSNPAYGPDTAFISFNRILDVKRQIEYPSLTFSTRNMK